MMDAIVQRVSDKVRGPRNPISELDLMDIAQVRAVAALAQQDLRLTLTERAGTDERSLERPRYLAALSVV